MVLDIEIRDSLNNDLVTIAPSTHIKQVLKTVLTKKEESIQSLRDKILKYEQKSRAEDAFYQSLSPLRKLFTGRAPSHHRAVEYMVNVKDRLKKIEDLKRQVTELTELLKHVNTPIDKMTISHSILEEIKPYL
ncbi:hypothetical protein PU629_19785 [Pullulanibacillus sp. KACC 23026]|uniref:hypothetical protein n=1 Tax=Pullulanibacillus sp. KACC 23026 TaxID=3028315 RepID=UPI0023B0960D|nr:hypothetical protein [Pullulanibacillus sp. KACC 23026]WEG12310.1 hypothetical protein PU629_19785 [Pullulanibacillus sp. KACC 23026]